MGYAGGQRFVLAGVDDHVFSVATLEQQRKLPVQKANGQTDGSAE